jgi:hypothetical protein
MSENDIQFEEDYGDSGFHIRSRKLLGEPTTPTMINFLLQKKIVKNEKQAMFILIIFILLFLSLSIFIIRSTITNNKELIIVNRYGQEIPFEDYIDMINRGVEPII